VLVNVFPTAGHYADMIKRQTSHVKDVQRSESMHLPEDLPYETYAKIGFVCNSCA
jgi:tRNA U34 5-carboxymethylaminomethyl modifying enzyme MnmG/GidA